MDESNNPTIQRLEDQIAWYDDRSRRSQRLFKGLMITEMICGALVPLFAGIGAPVVATGLLGVAIVLLQEYNISTSTNTTGLPIGQPARR